MSWDQLVDLIGGLNGKHSSGPDGIPHSVIKGASRLFQEGAADHSEQLDKSESTAKGLEGVLGCVHQEESLVAR